MKRPRARRRSSAGMTLVEVMVALLILAIAVTGLFTVVIATTRSRVTMEPHEEGLRSVESVGVSLRNYVSASTGASTASYAPGGSWALPGDESACASYALEPGCAHDATTLLPEAIKARYPGATVTYTVTRASEDDPYRVDFTIDLPRPE